MCPVFLTKEKKEIGCSGISLKNNTNRYDIKCEGVCRGDLADNMLRDLIRRLFEGRPV